MYRYRCEAGSTSRALKRIHRIQRLGKLLSIAGVRFLSTRGTGDDKYTTTHERIFVRGEHGTARFDGFCWSYSGEGPRGLYELLQCCGVNKPLAWDAAFLSKRGQNPQTDWKLVNGPNGWQFTEQAVAA